MRTLIFVMAVGLVAWAQEAAPEEKREGEKPPEAGDAGTREEDATKAEGIVVTAERLETQRRLSGEAYGVIRRKDYEIRRHDDTHEAIRFVPGVHVAQTSGKGGFTSLFIRGGESDHALILVDGVEVNSDGGGIDLSNLTNDGVGRIEVVRGTTASVWGADSLSGTVHVITKRGKGPPRAYVSAEAGNYSTYRERLRFEAGDDEYGVTLAISRYDRWDGRWDHSDYSNTTAVGRFDYRIGDATEVKATIRYIDEKAEQFAIDPGPLFVKEDPDGEKDEDDLILGAEIAHEFCPGWTVSFRAGRFDEDVRFEDLGPFQFDSTSDFDRTKFTLQSDARIVDREDLAFVFTAGLEWEREELVTTDSFSGGIGVNERRQNRALYAQTRFEAWDRLGISLSGRLDDSTAFGTEESGRAALTFDLKETGTRPHASIANGIKTPTMIESFSQNVFFLGNPNLDAEHSRSIDFGIEQRLWGDRIVADLTFFENRMFDLIAFVGGSPAFLNAGHARARGWELSVEAKPLDWLRIAGGWTYQRTRVTDSKTASLVFLEHERLIRRPDNAGFGEVGVEFYYEEGIPKEEREDHPRFRAAVTAQYVGNRDDVLFFSFPDAPARVRNNDYLKVDVSAEYWIVDRLVRVFGVCENVADTPYQEVAGYPNEGINFLLGLEFTFEVPKLKRSR